MVGVSGIEPPCNQLPFLLLIRERGYTPKLGFFFTLSSLQGLLRALLKVGYRTWFKENFHKKNYSLRLFTCFILDSNQGCQCRNSTLTKVSPVPSCLCFPIPLVALDLRHVSGACVFSQLN